MEWLGISMLFHRFTSVCLRSGALHEATFSAAAYSFIFSFAFVNCLYLLCYLCATLAKQKILSIIRHTDNMITCHLTI